jgi:hypothetical protein
MTLPAPGRFSTITVASSRFPSRGAIARAIASLLAPAENGTTILINFGTVTCPESCVSPAGDTASAAAESMSRDIKSRMVPHLHLIENVSHSIMVK